MILCVTHSSKLKQSAQSIFFLLEIRMAGFEGFDCASPDVSACGSDDEDLPEQSSPSGGKTKTNDGRSVESSRVTTEQTAR